MWTGNKRLCFTDRVKNILGKAFFISLGFVSSIQHIVNLIERCIPQRHNSSVLSSHLPHDHDACVCLHIHATCTYMPHACVFTWGSHILGHLIPFVVALMSLRKLCIGNTIVLRDT